VGSFEILTTRNCPQLPIIKAKTTHKSSGAHGARPAQGERTLRTPSARPAAQFATQPKIRYAHT
jgi:hypothetical protein